jgi:hypothetical protein
VGNLDGSGPVQVTDLNVVSTDKHDLVTTRRVRQPSAEMLAFPERLLFGLVESFLEVVERVGLVKGADSERMPFVEGVAIHCPRSLDGNRRVGENNEQVP